MTGYSLFEKLQSEKRKLISEKALLDKKDTHKYPISEPPFNIPSDWYWCYLSDISIIQEGPGIRKHQYEKEGIQFLTVTNILEGEVDINNSKKFISVNEYNKTYKHFKINKGDIVTACSGGSWGKSAIFNVEENLILNTSTLRLRFFNDLGDNRYLYYLTKMSYFKDSLSKHTTGQQPNYGYYHYSRILIPLPPLPEQTRIVSILDEAFAAIAKAKTNVEKNLQNAKELFESYLQKVFAENGEDWEEKKLEDICTLVNGRAYKQQELLDKGKYRVLRVGNFFTNRGWYYSDLELPEDKYCDKGDLLYAWSASFGPRIWNEEKVIYHYHIWKVIPNEKYVTKEFLYLLMDWDKEKIKKDQGTGTTMMHVGKGSMDKRIVPLPPLKEQQTIVQKLDALSTETKKLETIYEQKLDDLEELKKSVLQKAFRGELTSPEETLSDSEAATPLAGRA